MMLNYHSYHRIHENIKVNKSQQKTTKDSKRQQKSTKVNELFFTFLYFYVRIRRVLNPHRRYL